MRDGRFNYVPGVEVAFLIGGIQLGTAEGNNVITPIDLVAEANDADHPTVINILRFIQTLDDDGNPDNGITITAVVRDMAGGRSANSPSLLRISKVTATSLVHWMN